MLAADSMSGILTQAAPEDPRAKTVGSAIFGDGCAAALLSCDAGADGPVIVASQVHQVAGTLDAVLLESSRQQLPVPRARPARPRRRRTRARWSIASSPTTASTRAQIAHWMVHPGGRRIIESVQEALGLADEDVAISWEVLAEYGNVGTPRSSTCSGARSSGARRRPANTA